jgi:hypothetical protein
MIINRKLTQETELYITPGTKCRTITFPAKCRKGQLFKITKPDPKAKVILKHPQNWRSITIEF